MLVSLFYASPMDNEQLWQSVLGEIELNLSRANFTTWFKNTFISSFDENKVIICVPNTFTKAWLEKKYHQKISDALENISNQKISEIFYKVEIKKTNSINNLFNKNSNSIENQIKADVVKKPSTPVNRFGLNIRYLFENYIVGKGNELAHAACQAVAANPGQAYNPLFIYGGVGLGKTHLLQAVGHAISKRSEKILYITSEKFTNDYVQSIKSGQAKDFKDKYRNVDVLLIDDIQFMGGKDGTQEEFFHTFNELHQADKQIVITSDRPPRSIPALEKRLLSRFEWGMVADVTQPNIETRVAILDSKCKEKNYKLKDDILYYIANNIQNNIRELEGALNRLIAFYEFNNSTPTIDSTKSILSSLINNNKTKSLCASDVLNIVSSFFNVSNKDLLGKSRKKELVYPRQISMYLMRKEVAFSYPTIGQELGGRDHTTAMHAFNKISRELENNEKIKQDIESIKQTMYGSYT